MKFSIITTTLNNEDTLSDSMASIDCQSDVDIEYIVIDGGSTDKTLEIIRKNTCVTEFISQSGLSIYDGLNLGLKLVTGDIIGFLHSDDVLATNERLSEILEVFENNNVDGVYGDLQYVHRLKTERVIRNWKSDVFHPSLLNRGWMPPHPTLFLKRDVYFKHGEFDSSYRISADYDFIVRIFQDSTLNFKYLSKTITKMRIGGTSNRSLKNVLLKSREDLKIIKAHKIGGIYTLILKNVSKFKQFLT